MGSIQSVGKELAQVKVYDTIIIAARQQGRHRNDILRIVVPDGPEIAKFPLSRRLIGNQISHLHISPFTRWTRADKINLACQQLPYPDREAQADKVLINDILEHLLDISFTPTASNSVANAVILKVELDVDFKQE